jgi:hypothetical protein
MWWAGWISDRLLRLWRVDDLDGYVCGAAGCMSVFLDGFEGKFV